MNLPVSALMFPVPLIAAALLVYREEGSRGLRRLWKRVFDRAGIRPKRWYVPIVLLLPAIYLLSYVVMRLLGRSLPEPHVSILTAPILFAVFFVTAVGEESGWMGYAADPLQDRWSALTASVILGAVWGLWHTIPDLQAGHGPTWIVWQHGVYAIALRILIVWLFNNTSGAVLAAVLFHAMDNVSWSLFPNNGSHYDPAITGTITAIVAAAVVYLWGSKTLARYRY